MTLPRWRRTLITAHVAPDPGGVCPERARPTRGTPMGTTGPPIRDGEFRSEDLERLARELKTRAFLYEDPRAFRRGVDALIVALRNEQADSD
jgi:hypothetical protein